MEFHSQRDTKHYDDSADEPKDGFEVELHGVLSLLLRRPFFSDERQVGFGGKLFSATPGAGSAGTDARVHAAVPLAQGAVSVGYRAKAAQFE
jgi:hypothetical protein